VKLAARVEPFFTDQGKLKTAADSPLVKLQNHLRAQQALLGTLRTAYDRIAARLQAAGSSPRPHVPILGLVDAIADLEDSLTTREAARRIASHWIVVHTVASILLYGLLVLHIASGIYYGLRWLP
jgi:hypothetical protein